MSRSFTKQRFWLSTFAMWLFPLCWMNAASSAITPDPGTIRMSADKQSYNLEAKRYFLQGNVVVAFQDMKITGNKAEIEMDAAGKPLLAQFYNRPTFKRIKTKTLEDNVVGDIIKVYLAEDRYGAAGNVQSLIATVAAEPFYIRSDVQEFDNKNKVVSASGNVKVDYKGSQAFSSLANVRMKPDGKAERVIFSGKAQIKQENSIINGDRITVMVDSGNLIAEHHVATRVNLKDSPVATTPATAAANKPKTVFITSDYQQYDKSSDVMIASGNVKIIFDDYVATGPKATFKLKGNDLDHIFLTGRPTITEPGRVITADKITITTNPKNFDAVGNVKVNFQTADRSAQAAPAASSVKPGPKAPGSGKALPKDDASDY